MKATYLWLIQLAAGLLILVMVAVNLLLIHFRVILRFFGVQTPVSFATPAGPGVLGPWLLALAVIVLIHAFLGLRLTLLELAPSAQKMGAVNRALIAGGAALVIINVILLTV